MKTFNKNSILLLFFLIFAVGVGVYLVLQNTNFFSKAKFLAGLKDVVVANITDTSFSVTWVTDTPTSGYVVYGTKEDKLTNTATDDRDTNGPIKRFTHYVTLTDLLPSTNYYFKVGSDDRLYDDKGKPYTQVTAPISEETPTLSDLLIGKVKTAEGKIVEDALIYLIIGRSSILSTYPSKEGYFLITLNNTRTVDLSAYKKFEDLDKIFVAVQTGTEGQAIKELPVKDAKGTQEIVLNKKWSIFSNTAPTKLTPPTNVQTSCTNGILNISWTGPGPKYKLRAGKNLIKAQILDGTWDASHPNADDIAVNDYTQTSFSRNVGANNQSYIVWLHTDNNGVLSDRTFANNDAIVTCAAAGPAIPSNLSGSCTDNQLRLSWSSVAGADRYTLRINDLDDVNRLDLQDDNVIGTNYTFQATDGHSYDWWIHSYNNTTGGSDAIHGDLITCQ